MGRSLVLEFVGIAVVHLASVDSSVRAADVPFGIVVEFVAVHMELLDYWHGVAVVDKRIVKVICTFASDLEHGMGYFDRSVDMDREHKGMWAFPFVEGAFVVEDRVAGDSAGVQEEELQAAAAVVVHLNFRPMTLDLH